MPARAVELRSRGARWRVVCGCGVAGRGVSPPLPVVFGILAAVAALLFFALRVLPGRRSVLVAPEGRRAPRPVFGALMAGAAAAGFLGLLMPPGLRGWPDTVGRGTWAETAA